MAAPMRYMTQIEKRPMISAMYVPKGPTLQKMATTLEYMGKFLGICVRKRSNYPQIDHNSEMMLVESNSTTMGSAKYQ